MRPSYRAATEGGDVNGNVPWGIIFAVATLGFILVKLIGSLT